MYFTEKGRKSMEPVKDVPAYIRKMYEGNYFMTNFGINIEEIHCGSAVVSLDIVKEKHFNHRGVCHGGVLTALADAVLGVTGASVGEMVATMCENMNFIRPVSEEGRCYVKSHITHHGRTTMVIASRMYDKDGHTICTVSHTMYIIKSFEGIPREW